MDAEDCARALRAAGHGGALVALTSRAEKGHAAQLHDAGYAGYLSRPVRQAELRLVLEKVLRRGEDTALVTRYEDGGPIGKAAETEHFWSDAKVLVVDDNEVNREVATEMLRSFGCTVTEAGDGISAVRLVEKGAAFDLILMDCHMIEMDGYEAARRIRAFEGSEAHVPIVAVTAMAFMGVKERCLDVGMNDYLLKPFNPEILVKYMKRWLPKERHGYKEAADTPDEAEAAPPAPEPSPTLDMDKALWVTGGNHRLFHRTAKVFLRHMPERFEELSDAVQACEAEEVTRLAHSIKGASASVGGEALCEAAFVLEVAGRENREIEFGKCFEEMRARYGALEVALLEQLPGEEATKEAAEPEGS